ncbi:MAG TPA: hypothetical protein PLZ08_11310 [Bacillota bacterium]|mgnify:CR=1 FL=1|jgi:hypothetical protein|nr:hypothetical protein [Bacillota bacterium]HOL10716.1 hypothetical protein [Bacillota bacterium]HPO98526.1 hypothetical protein [Bacillota bacterium]
MKELLIIRSVSFQQLDRNLVAILERYPEHRISILTHEHGVLLAQKYKGIGHVYVYPYKEGFKFKNKVPAFQDKNFDVVIVPVTNITGAGFFNVLLFSLSLKAAQRVLCNVRSEFKELSGFSLLSLGLKNLGIAVLSYLCTAFLALFVILFLPFKLRKIEKKGES